MQKQCNNYDCIQGSRSKYARESGEKISIIKMYYFLFVTFLSKLSGFHARKKPNILEIRYIAVQYSKDVFIYLSRAGVSVKNVY